MCGIVGYLDKTGDGRGRLGQTMLGLLSALGCRGPDSAGVAMYGDPRGLVLRIKVGDGDGDAALAERVAAEIRAGASVLHADRRGPYLRVVVAEGPDPLGLARAVEGLDAAVEVVSLGRRLEVVKQVGSPENLDRTFGISRFQGTHGIGHARLSTESIVDLSHSQPFWAHGLPDLAVAHNGHITNYHKMRRRYETQGVRFYTGNDSEIIGVYLADRMARGDAFEDALQASLRDLDGSFCYVAATADGLGYAKDPFGLKPLMVADTDAFVAIATEEVALRRALGTGFDAVEPGARRSHAWRLPALAAPAAKP